MGSNYDGLAIPGSYIDVNDFGSIRELTDYLIYLDKNDDEYNKYISCKDRFSPSDENLFCDICEKLNSEEAKQHRQVILSKEFSYENNCGVNREKSKKLQRQIDHSKKDDSPLYLIFLNIFCWFHNFFH